MSQDDTQQITIDYFPQSYQQTIHSSNKRYRVLCIGRRGGKTEMALNELIKAATTVPGLYWYVAPFYNQAKTIAWVRLKDLLAPLKDYVKFNEQELYAEFLPTNSRIALIGADNETRLLGVGIKGVVLDECALLKETVWTRIIRPMLADTRGWAMFISTPRGRNWFYDIFCRDHKDWQSWNYPTSVNEYIAKEEIDEAKKDLPKRLFSQEFEAAFLDEDTGVFKGIRQIIGGEPQDAILGRDYVTGIDLAKTYDFTVLCTIDRITREVVALERFQDVKWVQQQLQIQEHSFRYNNSFCIIDSTGVGDPIVESLSSSNISMFYEDSKPGFKITSASKAPLIQNLVIAIEQRLIRIPKEFDVLIKELQAYEYQITKNGNITYNAPEGKHDDCVIALALAVWAIRHELRSAQVVKRDHVAYTEDRQGYGERALPDYDEENIQGGY